MPATVWHLVLASATVLVLAAVCSNSPEEPTAPPVDSDAEPPVATSPPPDTPAAADRAPAPTAERFRDQDNAHVLLDQPHPPYNSVPATSGWHYGHPLAPAPWGVHGVVLPDEVLVHNLEHGGIGVHYHCPDRCPELVARLAGVVQQMVARGEKVIMTPYPGIGTRIALTAWTFLDKFNDFDEERILEFIRAHESSPNAPEPSVR